MDNKTLVTNGCSWVYGDRLDNPLDDNFTTTLAYNSWFEQVYNLSIKKGSNSRIARVTVHWLLEHKEMWDDIFVLIGWTGAIDRPEFYSDMQAKWIPINNWNIKEDRHLKSTADRQDRDMAKKYYEYHWSELSSFQDYFDNVLLFQNFLKSNNIKYYFFRSFAFENPYTKKHYGYNKVIQSGLDVLRGKFGLVDNVMGNTKTHEYSDEEIWNRYVDAGWIPKHWKDAIDLELFPSFVDFNRTFHHYVHDNIREDGKTFREHYPTHPNKKEHDMWAKQIQREISV
jgi:hypothetical protein